MCDTYPMFRFLEILDANYIAQPSSGLLEPVFDCLSPHGKGTEKQTLVQVVGNTFTICSCNVSCSRATKAMELHYMFIDNPSIEHREQYEPSK